MGDSLFVLPNHNLDLQSSSFTLGNASKLSLRSLHHDLTAVADVDTFLRV